MDRPPELEKLLEGDELLRGHEGDLLQRWRRFSALERRVGAAEGGLAEFGLGYRDWGIVQRAGGEVTVREWVEAAEKVALVGDFNGWSTSSHVCSRDEYGVFSLTVPPLGDGSPAVPHGSQVKLWVRSKSGEEFYRLSPWTKYATQVMADLSLSHLSLSISCSLHTEHGGVSGLQRDPLGPTHSLSLAAREGTQT